VEGELYHCDLGINLLTVLCLEDKPFVEFSWVRSVREEEKMEEHNAAIAADYEGRKARSGISGRDAAETVAALNGISPCRVRQIAEGLRLARSEEKRKRGHPKKVS
jgi:CTP:molybdopterin cytidylyltransferase MocA